MKGKKVFITGGAGFIGSKLASYLCDNNDVIIYDNLDRNSLLSDDFNKIDNVRVVKGSVLDLDGMRKASKDCDIFVHAAAVAGIDNTVRSPVKTMTVNMIGTANALEVAQSITDLERFLDFSTSEVFGSRAYRVEESDTASTGAVGEARWSYAVSKLAGEHLTYAYSQEYNLPAVTVRPFNVYGPGQTGEGAISIMIRRALKNEDIYIFGDGSQIRAWCYIDDMLQGALKALSSKKAIGESFNIGNARAVTTIYGLSEIICRVLNSKSNIIFKPPLSADIELRIPSVEKARDIIGFEAKVNLDEGILRTAEWISSNYDILPKLAPIFEGESI